ncbi:MAG: O-antigen ligase family protein [Chloroflexota bacterium]
MNVVVRTPNSRLGRLRDRLLVELDAHRLIGTAVIVLLVAACGLAGGFALGIAPLPVIGGLVGAMALFAVVSEPRVGLFGVLAVITLLPFGVVPLPVGGVQFTFLDITLTLTLVLWLVRKAFLPEERLVVTPAGVFVLIYLGITVVAFANGLAYGISASDARLYLKSINSALFFFTIANCVQPRREGGRLLLVLLLGAAAAGAVGVFLCLLPNDLTIAILSKLGSLGYPTGPEVLRFIAESDRLRAVGTSIDPNVFGAMLMVAGVLGATQLPAPRAVVDKRLLWLLLPPIGLALLLSLSRSSWVGFAAGIAFASTVRYRRLWLLILPAGLLLLSGVIPGTSSFAGHLLTGLRLEDRATLMRLGEYKDALALISAYPWLGVGYGNAPSADLYIGVSSVYLLLAEHAGLVGLGSYLLAVGAVFGYTLPVIGRGVDERLETLALSCLSALAGAMAAGFLDHHFVNMTFPHVVALFWLCAGLAVVTAKAIRESANTAQKGMRRQVGS